MPKLTNGVPSRRLHKQSGQAICTLNGRDFLLGPWKSDASKKRYDQLIKKWLANDRQPFEPERKILLSLSECWHCYKS